jgi:uncharacterized protein DUF4124
MKIFAVTALTLLLLPMTVLAKENQKLYRWVDKDGLVHYGDSIPAEYAELEKQVVNVHGVTVDTLHGKKSAEEIAEDERQALLARELELRKRADQALLATYMSIEEILMHRDRRVELFQAQTRVTELYLRNLQRRLDGLMADASKFQPYSDDPDAPMIGRDLTDDIASTKETIERHEGNLRRFKSDESDIVARFEVDILRFKRLKGLDKQAATTQ